MSGLFLSEDYGSVRQTNERLTMLKHHLKNYASLMLAQHPVATLVALVAIATLVVFILAQGLIFEALVIGALIAAAIEFW